MIPRKHSTLSWIGGGTSGHVYRIHCRKRSVAPVRVHHSRVGTCCWA